MAAKESIEIESKYSVDPGVDTPKLESITAVDHISSTAIHLLSAVYYDTADLRLTRSKITLRRRTGGKDAGWHLKLPASYGRREIAEALGEDPGPGMPAPVPASLLAPVRAIVRDLELSPIARVDNERHESVLTGVDGNTVAEFCDDHVTAWSLLPGGQRTTWREWELELAPGMAASDEAESVMISAGAVFAAAGASPSESPSKLVAALGESINNVPSDEILADLDPSSAAYAVLVALKTNRDRLIEMDPKVRRDEEDSVHQMRVATRELRSHMQTFEGILAGETYTHLEKELKALAGMLGIARDAEVVEARFRQSLTHEDPSIIDDATRTRLTDDIATDYKKALADVVHMLDSQRYIDLLNGLDSILKNPPLAENQKDEEETAQENPVEDLPTRPDEQQNTEPTAVLRTGEDDEARPKKSKRKRTAEDILVEHLSSAYGKLMTRHAQAINQWEDIAIPLRTREDNFHSMRKAAKKLRYSAEAAGAATDLKTKKLYKACKRMQEVLGDFQDSVTARDMLLAKAHLAREAGEDTFGYGVLFQVEHTRGLEALADYGDCVKDIESAYAALVSKKAKKKKK